MENITSFCINHDILPKGMYISRIDGDIVTYDLRFVIPNTPPYLSNAGLHTIEHLFATYVRNSKYAEDIIYFGPMGCRTGFYFLVRDHMRPEEAIALVQETMQFILDFEGPIPGAQASRECGNYLEHSLTDAKKYAKDYAQVLANYATNQLKYPE